MFRYHTWLYANAILSPPTLVFFVMYFDVTCASNRGAKLTCCSEWHTFCAVSISKTSCTSARKDRTAVEEEEEENIHRQQLIMNKHMGGHLYAGRTTAPSEREGLTLIDVTAALCCISACFDMLSVTVHLPSPAITLLGMNY